MSTIICKICNQECNGNRGINTHVRSHNLHIKDYYDLYVREENEGICQHPDCNKETTYEKFGYRKFCSYACANSSPSFHEKREKTWQANYGVKNPKNSPAIQEKISKTMVEKYGCEHYIQSEHYENNKHLINEKRNATFEEKYGGHPWKNSEILDKRTQTNIKKYGVVNPSQNPEIHSKKFRKKVYTFPSGRTEYIQGYEGKAIDLLLNMIDENDIIIDNNKMPSIDYEYKGKNRKYFPDVWIPSLNTFIEVKGIYTMNADYEINMAKHEYTEKAGYIHVFWIMER